MAEARDRPHTTSERIGAEPGASHSDRLIYLLHLASYDFAVPFAEGLSVLDLGCGTGYGTARLAARCGSTVGVDVSAEAVQEASARYQAPNLRFQRIAPTEIAPLPFDDSSFDVVLSFQVIEHVADPIGYLREAKRVLREGGVMVLATPDRATRLYRGQRPWNRFHLREYTAGQLEALLRSVFATVEMYGMGGPADFLEPELRRTRRLRIATLPFTFPGCPETWRRVGLETLTWLRAAGRRRAVSARADMAGEASSGGAGREMAPGREGRPAEVHIAPGITPSVCIVAVAR